MNVVEVNFSPFFVSELNAMHVSLLRGEHFL